MPRVDEVDSDQPEPNNEAAGSDEARPETETEEEAEETDAVSEKPVDAKSGDEPPTETPEPVTSVPKKRRWVRQVAEIPALIALAFVIAIVIKTFLVQAFFIPSGSMIPTLHVGDRVLVEKISYRLHDPERGDVVVFAKSVFGSPPDVPWYDDARNYVRELLGMQAGSGVEDYIKRVVAIGGDKIRYVGSPRRLYINGEVVPEPYIRRGEDRVSSTITSDDCKRLDMDVSGEGCIVPAGRVFVMGDNRANSQDSRSIGPVDEDKIVGRAFVIIWPPSDAGTL